MKKNNIDIVEFLARCTTFGESVTITTNDIDKVAKNLYPVFKMNNLIRSDLPDMEHDIIMLHSLCSWRRYKQIYRLNKEFLESLPESNDMKINSLNLPFNSFFMKLEYDLVINRNDRAVGAFIEVCEFKVENEYRKCISIVIEFDSRKEIIIFIYFDEKTAFSDIINKYADAMPDDLKTEIVVYISKIFSALCYLSMEEPDISSAATKKIDKVVKGKRIKLKNIKECTVGDRYIKECKRIKKSLIKHPTNKNSGYKQPPVFRKGHFKVVHYGKGKKQSKIMWIDGYRTHKEIKGEFNTVRDVQK